MGCCDQNPIAPCDIASGNKRKLNVINLACTNCSLTDATAAAIVPDDGLDGYQAALTNFRFLASDLWTTEEAVTAMGTHISVAAK